MAAVVIGAAAGSGCAAQAQALYYCDNPRGYYPTVQTCNSPWRQVAPPSNRPPAAPSRPSGAAVPASPGSRLGGSVQALYESCKAGGTDCVDYIAGIGDAMRMNAVLKSVVPAKSWAVIAKLAVCEAPSYEAMRQAFLNWAERHPEQWNKAPSIGVVAALRERWPCSVTAR